MGIGRGYQKMEFDGFDLKIGASRDTFLEQMAIMKKAWTEDDFTHQGRFFTIPRPITMLPKPLQKPHPQIWVACQSDQSVDWTAAQGYLPLFSGSPCSREPTKSWSAFSTSSKRDIPGFAARPAPSSRRVSRSSAPV